MSRIELSLTRPAGVLLPEAIFTGALTVRNAGPEVEHFVLAPAGSLATWTRLETTEVRLWPGEDSTVAIEVSVPRAPAPRAGPATIAVSVQGGDGLPAALVEHPVEVAAAPVPSLGSPYPGALGSAHHVRVEVEVANDGNVRLPLRLLAGDREGRIRAADPDGEVIHLEPGERVYRPIRLTATRVSWLGKDIPREYTVRLQAPPVSGPTPIERTASGVLSQEPVLRRWWLVALAALVVVGFFVDSDGLVPVVVVLLGGLLIAVVGLVRYLRTVTGRRSRSPRSG